MGSKFVNKVPKVDNEGSKIKDFKAWRKANPDLEFYDSSYEYVVCKRLRKEGIEYERSVAIELYPKSKEEEIHVPPRKRNAKGVLVRDKNSKPSIRTKSNANIVYTPDIYLPEHDLYLEVKGYDTDVFKLRWRLFKKQGYKGFTIHNMDELNLVMDHIKNNNNN